MKSLWNNLYYRTLPDITRHILMTIRNPYEPVYLMFLYSTVDHSGLIVI